MERFNLEKHWQEFIEGKIVVNCRTKELAKEFLEYCENKGLEWGILPKTNYFLYKENTYYRCVKNLIKFGDIKWFKDNGDLIVEFKGFKSNITYDPNIDYQAILNANPNMLESERDILIDKRNIKIWGNILKKPKSKPEVTKENIEVIYNGNEIIVIIRDGKRFYKGVAKCSPEDIYNKEIGFQTAYSRARIKQIHQKVKKNQQTKFEVGNNPKYECKGNCTIELFNTDTSFISKIDASKYTSLELGKIVHELLESINKKDTVDFGINDCTTISLVDANTNKVLFTTEVDSKDVKLQADNIYEKLYNQDVDTINSAIKTIKAVADKKNKNK